MDCCKNCVWFKETLRYGHMPMGIGTCIQEKGTLYLKNRTLDQEACNLFEKKKEGNVDDK